MNSKKCFETISFEKKEENKLRNLLITTIQRNENILNYQSTELIFQVKQFFNKLTIKNVDFYIHIQIILF